MSKCKGENHCYPIVMYAIFSAMFAAAFFGAAASVPLGHGEKIEGGRYSFCADLTSESARDCRALLRHNCRFQSKSWWFFRKSFVEYRHDAQSVPMSKASLFLSTTVNHKKAHGEVLAEARLPGGGWRKLGVLPHHSSCRFELPPDMFPAKVVEVRIRGAKTCSLQVSKYVFSADVEETGASAGSKDYGVWGVSSGVKVRRQGCPEDAKLAKITMHAAANEAESAQVVIRPKCNLADVRVEATSLVCAETGAKLPADAVKIFRVEYVPVEIPSDWKGGTGLWPDPLPPQDKSAFPVKAGEYQPFWVTVKPPKGTAKGFYRGELKVRGLDASLPIEVEVFGFEFPDVMTCKTVFGLKVRYGAYQYHKPKTRDERRSIVERYYSAMSDLHLSPGVISQFASKEKKEGVLEWKDWDREIERILGKYHFNTLRINLSGLGGGNQFRRREPVFMGVSGTNENYHALMGKYLGEVERHIKEKGWLDMAYVYWYDEPSEKDYPFVRKGFDTLKRHAPSLKGMITKQPSAALLGCVDIWCPQPQRLHLEHEAAARARGDGFWWYVCNNPPAPYVGEAIDHPGPEMRVWLWQTWGENVTGVLLWRCDYWDIDKRQDIVETGVKNPYLDPMTWNGEVSAAQGLRHPTVNGEGFLLYPPKACFGADGKLADNGFVDEAPVSSIRAEHLRDGIEDYEYFAMLKRLDPSNSLLKVPTDVYSSLESYAEDSVSMERHRLLLAREIERKVKGYFGKSR